MKENKLNKNNVKFKYCPICDEEHELVIKSKKEIVNIKNTKIECELFYYYCKETDEWFEDGDLVDKNLKLIRDEYRKLNNLLTTKEIIAIRKKYGLTQEDFAKILDLGEKTIARYESKIIQDKPFDILMRKFNEDYNFALELVERAKTKLGNKFDAILSRIQGFVIHYSERVLNETQLNNQYILYDKECESNGYKTFDIAKIKSMLSYFAQNTENLYQVKMSKLFWYSDALAYINTGHAMSGLVYRHMNMGALPNGYREIALLDSVEREEKEMYDAIVEKIVPCKVDTFDDSLFTNVEKKILKQVCAKFGKLSGKDLSEIMHQEDIYQATQSGEILSFEQINTLKAIKYID